MAKGNNNNRRKNWFEQQRERYGDAWLDRIADNELSNNCSRVMQDIARGNFDINGTDFQDFVYQGRMICKVKEYSGTKAAEFHEICKGLTAIMNDTNLQSSNTAPTLERCQKILEIYWATFQYLEAYMMTGDPTHIVRWQQDLKCYRNYIDLNRAL